MVWDDSFYLWICLLLFDHTNIYDFQINVLTGLWCLKGTQAPLLHMLGMHFWSWGTRMEIVFAHYMALMILRWVMHSYMTLEWSYPIDSNFTFFFHMLEIGWILWWTHSTPSVIWLCSLFLLLTLGTNILLQSAFDAMGAIVSFNLKRPDGSWFGYREVEKLASLSNIQLRVRLYPLCQEHVISSLQFLNLFKNCSFCLSIYICHNV